jgi:hypothetical protein
MSKCSHPHSQYLYHASAYGLAAEIDRPVKQSIHAQAATALSSGGGRGTDRVDKFCVPPFVSFESAYCEVGGSFDECHNMHTTYASAVVEGLNIFDVVTADRVVSRMVIYSPGLEGDEDESSYDITGSHFDNLRIAGHQIDVKLPATVVQKHEKYSSFEKAFHGSQGHELMPWGNKSPEELEAMEEQYHALGGIAKRAKAWKKQQSKGGAYRASVAGHLDLKDSGLAGFGSIVLVPKFGVVRLAELIVHKDYRRLTMFNVQMCSGSRGGADGGTAGGSGGTTYP